jgi:hypothetical protein
MDTLEPPKRRPDSLGGGFNLIDVVLVACLVGYALFMWAR